MYIGQICEELDRIHNELHEHTLCRKSDVELLDIRNRVMGLQRAFLRCTFISWRADVPDIYGIEYIRRQLIEVEKTIDTFIQVIGK